LNTLVAFALAKSPGRSHLFLMGQTKNNRLLRTGIIGTIVSALCCFTPLLVFALGGLGLSAWLGWLDYVLLPALAGFMGLVVFALLTRRREK
jgi:mercuric ion transport protein